ncbi:KH domain-containing protein [Desulfosarcina cetonica]|uniref:KH domain-containing protein n=1 Tax=Desulfosarcina cetonica TaxID=90730 RepID=UPI0009FB8ECC|nr:KH domain-containing protein [Desulfosarcina cetonica]
MQALLKTIAEALVDDPEAVSISTTESNHSMILRLRVNPDDTGKIIGKQGRTAKALRTLLNAAAAKEKKHSILEIIEESDRKTADYKKHHASMDPPVVIQRASHHPST